jgi:hypothetical protein
MCNNARLTAHGVANRRFVERTVAPHFANLWAVALRVAEVGEKPAKIARGGTDAATHLKALGKRGNAMLVVETNPNNLSTQ